MIFSSLPADVVDRILTSLTDFRSLSVFLRTSNRHVFQVFQSHPKSIVAAIAQNITSPAHAQALRLLHLNTFTKSWASGEAHSVDEILDENEVIDKFTLTRDGGELMEKYAEVANGLTNVFSQRYRFTGSYEHTTY